MDWLLKALDLRRTVGQDRVRITSLGVALSDTTHTDSYGRSWQQRVYAIPHLNVYLSSWLLPTPDGYVGFLLMAGSTQRELLNDRAMRFADLFDTSLTGTIAQWRAYLGRRNTLPRSLEGLQLDTGNTWAVRTKRFVFHAPAAMVSLSESSVLRLTLGFLPQDSQTLWDIQGVQWAPDATAKTSFALQRRIKPPGTAKPTLRTLYEDIRNRRAPYGGTADRNSSTTWRLFRVVDVPATQAGQIAADVVYTVSLSVDSPGRLNNSLLVSGQMADALQILEKGQADNSVPAPVEAVATLPVNSTTALAAFEALAERVLAGLKTNPDPDLTDSRHRHFADDIRDTLAKKRTEFQVAEPDSKNLMNDFFRQVQMVAAYWMTVKFTTSNGDIWPAFLARNDLPAAMKHGAIVQAAEQALADAQSQSTLPEARWVALAQQLSNAYVTERQNLYRERPLAESSYRQRSSACTPPAEKTAPGPKPAMAPFQPDALEYYPPADRVKGLEGAVVVAVKVSMTGCVKQLAVSGSSGAENLDEAALRYAETLSFLPAVNDGKPIAGHTVFRVRFALRE
jgi:hypothetical protein